MRATDHGLIRTLVENWAEAVRRQDIEGAVRHHAQDILLFDVPPPLQSRGIDGYRDSWDKFFDWAEGRGVFDLSELEITASDTVAFCHGIIRCAGRGVDGRTELRIRLTVGLRKIAGHWTVTHEHHSEPSA